MALAKINSVYKTAGLFDGPFDGESVEYSKYRHLWNLAVQMTMRIVVLFHLIVFLTDDESLKCNLIYMRFSNDFGSRYLNLSNYSIVIISFGAEIVR